MPILLSSGTLTLRPPESRQGKTICEACLVSSQDGHRQLQMHAVSGELTAANSPESCCSLGKGQRELVHPWHTDLTCLWKEREVPLSHNVLSLSHMLKKSKIKFAS